VEILKLNESLQRLIDGQREANNLINRLREEAEQIKERNRIRKREDCCDPEFASITVKKFKECKNKAPVFEYAIVSVLKGTEAACSSMFDQAANALGAQCSQEEATAYAAVPEWWQIRPEAKRPQLILQFCVKGDDGKWGSPKYSISLPHPKSTEKLLTAPLPDYEKGNFEAVLRLKDNSKLIINCSSRNECDRVVKILKGFISDEALKGSDIKFSERNGLPVKRQKMSAKFATYFEKGVEDVANYKWKARFDLPS